MKYEFNLYRRRSIRLAGYDYSQEGAYFITICTYDEKNLFGNCIGGQVCLNEAGQMIENFWHAMAIRFQGVALDEYIVMPNHFHGIVVVGAALVAAPSPTAERAGTRPARTIGDVIGAFKSLTTGEYILGVKEGKYPSFKKRVWHRNYYEHIIRDENDLSRIRVYIRNNPRNWRPPTVKAK